MNRLAAIVSSSNETIVSWSPNKTITSWNPSAERLYKWTEAEILLKNARGEIPRAKTCWLAWVGMNLRCCCWEQTGNSSAETLLKYADLAMYQAKEHGRSQWQIFGPAMTEAAQERLTLGSSLRKAIERDDLTLFYQPQVSLSTGEIVGMEALYPAGRGNRPYQAVARAIISMAHALELEVVADTARRCPQRCWNTFAGIGGSSEKELAASSRVILFGVTLKKRPPPVQLNRLHPVVVTGNIGAA